MAEGEIDNLTMEQYLALTRGNQASGVVKPEIGGNVNFEIKSQFMRELREDTFFGNKNDDAHEHVERVLDIVSLFNIPGVSHDAVMLRVFPITLTGAAKRWVDRLPPGTVNSWDLLKKAFIQRYCSPSKTAKQLEEIRNFKQEGDETLYQAWERYNDLLYKCPTHDINNHQKTMADHSQKWHDRSSSKNIKSSSNSEGIAAIYGGAHLDKDCPLNEEVKSIEEAKYGEFGRPSPFSNRAKYRVGPPRYYTRMDNRPPVGEKRPSLEELMNKHLEESTRRRTEMEEWVKNLQENAEINTRNQAASLKNLETQIEQLTKEFYTKAANEINSPSLNQCKAVYADKKTSLDNGRHEISSASNKCTQIVQTNDVSPKILPCQLLPKELNPGNFTLPCIIGSLNFYAMADLGASVNVIPKSIFEYLKLARLKKTDMLVEMADMTKISPIRIVENVLVKIDKFLFPSDFVVTNMLNTRNETMILGRPFPATIHAEIDVFNKEISLGIGGDKVTFNMDKKIHNFTTPIGEIYMINATSNTPSDASSRVEETNNVHNKNNSCNQEQGRSRKKPRKLKFDINLPSTHFCKPVKQILEGELKFWPICDPNIKECNGGHKVYEMNKEGDLIKWYCYYDDRKRINRAGLSFPEFLLIKYGENQEKGLIWDERFEEWCINNPNTPTSRYTKVQENLNPKPKDYPFKD
ncbi:reverse transcriptase domain-containing protein [Tanacetum coccineum]